MRRRAVPVLLGLALALSAAALAAQGSRAQQQRPTFRTGVELVRVDVVVLDADGQPVTDLTADDFVIFDRGQPRPVASFSEMARLGRAESPEPSPPVHIPADVADNASVRSDRVIVLVIDDANLWIERVDLVKSLAHRVVDDLAAGASMAVVFTSGKNGVEVTQDPGLLHRAIDGLGGVHYVFRARGACTEQSFQNCQMLDALTLVAEAIGDETDSRRKAVIVISEWQGAAVRGLFKPEESLDAPEGSSIGFPPTPPPCEDPPFESRHEFELRQLMRAFRRANVTFYGIDPKGGLATSRARTLESRGESPIRPCDDPLQASQQVFRETAEATGGFAIVNTDELDAGLDRVVADLDNFYLLGFHPEDPADESWHQLQVQVKRPGLFVRHRRGYQLGDPPEPPKNDDPLVALSAGVLPKSALPLRLFATPDARVNRDSRVAITAEVRVPAARLERPGGRLEDSLTLGVIAVDMKNQKVSETGRHAVDVGVPRSRVSADGDVTYQLVFGLVLSPGIYQLRVSAESARMGAAGSVYLVVEVPDVRDARVAIAGPTIGFAPGSPSSASLTLAEDGLLPAGLDPVLNRVFTPADILRVHYQVWRRDERLEIPARLDVVDEADRVVLTRDDVIAGGSDGVVDTSIPLAALPPGSYRIRLSASTGEFHADREVGFAVRAR
jgi:VWFA-related protein